MNPSCRRSIRSGALVLSCALLAVAVSTIAFAGSSPRKADPGGNGGNPQVFPPGSNPYGASYATWTTRWWQWAYSLPVTGHPLFDETGADCAAGQSGPVWYLGGIFNVSGSAVRDLCTVPAGKAIFFPIVNAEWDNVCPPANLSLAELRQMVTAAIDGASGLACEIDGVPVENLNLYRFAGPTFGVDMPAGSIFDLFCGTPAGHYEPLVPDGYYLMLKPLPPGPHTLHFTGGFPGFTLEITYHLTVGSGGQAATIDEAEPNVAKPGAGTNDSGPAKPSWGQVKAIYR
jgi:hypothetical protein